LVRASRAAALASAGRAPSALFEASASLFSLSAMNCEIAFAFSPSSSFSAASVSMSCPWSEANCDCDRSRLDERRIGNGPETRGVHAADDARLQPQVVGGANQVLGARQTPGQRELMAQLRRIGGDAEVARDNCKRREPGVERLRALELRMRLVGRRFRRNGDHRSTVKASPDLEIAGV
jgi:hypothetical protein